jgi:Cu-Zn family superoxide dismutase
MVPLVASVALMSACKPNQPPATSPGTQPPIWTGSPAPSSAKPTGQQGGTDSLTTQLIAPNGTKVATAKFEFNQGYVTITIETTGTGQLSPGFHGVHIHSVGKCEANSVAPTGGAARRLLVRRRALSWRLVTSTESGDLTSLAGPQGWWGAARDHHRRVHQG